MTYTMEHINKTMSDYRDIEKTIAKMGYDIGTIRGEDTKRWSFSKWKFEYDNEPKKIDEDDYYLDGGELRNCYTGSLLSDDKAEYKRKLEECRMIYATYYLGYESEYESITFPASYLWTENWRDIETATMAEKKAREESIAAAKHAKDTEAKEKREKAEYERLCAKFGKGE